MSNLENTKSWVIREKHTGTVKFETFLPRLVSALNTVKYEAVPIHDYLASINGSKPYTMDELGRIVKPLPRKPKTDR